LPGFIEKLLEKLIEPGAGQDLHLLEAATQRLGQEQASGFFLAGAWINWGREATGELNKLYPELPELALNPEPKVTNGWS